MGSYARFRIGEYEFGQIKNVVDDEVLAIFNDDMLVRETQWASKYYEWWPRENPADDSSSDEDYEVEVIKLIAPGPVVSARLDLLGITAEEASALLQRELEATVSYHLDDLELDDPELTEQSRQVVQAVSSLTTESWLGAVRDLEAAIAESRPYQVGSPAWHLDLIDYWEWRHALRLLLVAFPDQEVELDLTDLAEGGWLDTEFEVFRPSVAMGTLRQTLATHAPIVVLTEGRTDAEFLEASLLLLYPHFKDLVRFLDYETKPEGGAAALLRTVKAFAAAGITNRVVAVLDNDAAARDALRGIDLQALPANIKVIRYPDIELATAYPTLGPPSASAPEGRLELADVNGLAASVELYLGRDVLGDNDGQLKPVQWRSFLQGVSAYQGEVMGKDAIHKNFRRKLKQADVSTSSGQDWGDMRAVLDEILEAFQGRRLPDHICEHTGQSETTLRLRRLGRAGD
ncbi:MAG: HEPN/Toprim-associated domain-containing protein [Nocardioides sp.]